MALPSDFYADVIPLVPGCPEPMVDTQVNRAARDFCIRSGIWREDLAAIAIASGTAVYTPTPPVGAVIVRIESMRHDDLAVPPVSEREMDFLNPLWRTESGSIPAAYMSPTPDTIRIQPIPDAVGGMLYIKAVLCPTPGASTIPDLLLNNWIEEIASGAAAKLLAMPKKAWSDAGAAAYHMSVFVRAAKRARNLAIKGGVTRSLTIRPRSFI